MFMNIGEDLTNARRKLIKVLRDSALPGNILGVHQFHLVRNTKDIDPANIFFSNE